MDDDRKKLILKANSICIQTAAAAVQYTIMDSDTEEEEEKEELYRRRTINEEAILELIRKQNLLYEGALNLLSGQVPQKEAEEMYKQ